MKSMVMKLIQRILVRLIILVKIVNHETRDISVKKTVLVVYSIVSTVVIIIQPV